jgi:hypothetical protein
VMVSVCASSSVTASSCGEIDGQSCPLFGATCADRVAECDCGAADGGGNRWACQYLAFDL